MMPTPQQLEKLRKWLSLQTKEFIEEFGPTTAETCWIYYANAYAVETAPGRNDARTLDECIQCWTDMFGGKELID